MIPIDRTKYVFLNIDPNVGSVFTFGRCAMRPNAPMGTLCVMSRYKV